MVEEKLDELEVIHIRFRNREIAAFDISVVSGKIQRGPVAFVRLVHIRAALDQIFGQFVMPVIGGR